MKVWCELLQLDPQVEWIEHGIFEALEDDESIYDYCVRVQEQEPGLYHVEVQFNIRCYHQPDWVRVLLQDQLNYPEQLLKFEML